MNDSKKNALITIITATFNAEISLNSLIKSIIPQKSENVEFIIIDGGSTDNTLSIIKNNNHIIDYWVSEPDKGIYDAWNKGIKVANGQWIMFVGADDLLYPNTIANYLQILNPEQNTDVDLISGHVCYINEKGEMLKLLGSEFTWNKMKKNMCVAHVGSLHNANLFKEVGLYNLQFKICGDYELLLRKKEKLRSLFLNQNVAQMKTGGMSFSTAAIKETSSIRKTHKTIGSVANMYLFIRDTLAFCLFRLKNI